MKLFQKRRDAIDIDERDSDVGSNHVFHGIEGRPFDRDGLPQYSTSNDYANGGNWISKRPSNGMEYGKNRQSIGGLVRKLNCASSKNHDYGLYRHLAVRGGETDEFGEVNSIASPSGTNNSLLKTTAPILGKEAKSEITRPVLITVKNGDVNEQFPLSDDSDRDFYQDTELRSSFVVGEFPPPSKMCTSASFRLGMSARKRCQNASKYFKHKDRDRDNDRNWSDSGGSSKNRNFHYDQEIEQRRSAQEEARRERWKRGLEMENRMYKNSKSWAKPSSGREKHGDESSSTDSHTLGSHTTGTSITGYDTSEDSSSIDDWTYATDESPTKHHYYHRNYPHGHCTNGQQVVASVAEDFGIFAKLILSDGVACFGTAAEITKETVGSCKGEEIPTKRYAERRNERRYERRRWSLKHS